MQNFSYEISHSAIQLKDPRFYLRISTSEYDKSVAIWQ